MKLRYISLCIAVQFRRCKNHNETTLHLFMHCRPVSLLWDTVLSHIKNLDLDLNLVSLEQFIVIGFASIKISPIHSPQLPSVI